MKILIPNILFVILIGLLTIWLTFLTTKGSLTNNTFKKITKRLTNRGKLVVIIFISITALLVGQEINNQNQNFNQTHILKEERNSRDKTITEGIKKGVDSISKKLFEDISIAFSKQELKLDTLNQEITNIRNKPSNINYTGASPVIMLDSSSLSLVRVIGPIKKYKLRFLVNDAGATNFKIKFGILDEFIDGSYSYQEMNFFPDQIKMGKNTSWTTGFTTMIDKDTKELFLYLNGIYSSIDGLQKYPINDIYRYNPIDKKLSIPLNRERNEIIEIINKIPKDGTVTKY